MQIKERGIVAPLVLAALAAAAISLFYLYSHGSLNTVTSQITNTPAGGKVEVSPSAEAKITITANGFVPATITIAKNQEVSWINTDKASHQIASNDQIVFNSDLLKTNDSYSYIYENSGTYEIHDLQNPKLKATIIVK